MKAMILAAGRGERMRPLTDTTPKPLLEVGGKALIVHHIENLVRCGFKEIVINIAHLGDKIINALGDGSRWGVKILYSDEQKVGGLETLGGIVNAMLLLGDAPFLVVNADIYTEYEFNSAFDLGERLAHLILVPNPPQHERGDFGLEGESVVNEAENMYTFSGIAYYNPKLFVGLEVKKMPLAPHLRAAIEKNGISGEVFTNKWHDVGTPKRLKEINNEIKNTPTS